MKHQKGLFINFAVGAAAFAGGMLSEQYRLRFPLDAAIAESKDKIENYRDEPALVYSRFFRDTCELAGRSSLKKPHQYY